VSHDFVIDPEVMELRKAFGDWMALVWIHMLSIADRNDGRLKGDQGLIAASLAHISGSMKLSWARDRVLAALRWMADKGWIEVRSDAVLIRNYSEYHKTRGKKESQEGFQWHPLLPILPTEPSLQGSLTGSGRQAAPQSPEMTTQEFIESWNEICASEGLPAVKDLSNGRRKKIAARLRRYPSVDFWEQVFNGVNRSDFLSGRKPSAEHPNWRATIDWLIENDENPLKVVEGSYA
jgi:hypothetical protein